MNMITDTDFFTSSAIALQKQIVLIVESFFYIFKNICICQFYMEYIVQL